MQPQKSASADSTSNYLPTMPAPPEDPPEMRTTTLAELGSNMPVGILAGDKLVKPFRLRPFRLKEEKELGALREGTKGMTFGQFTSGVLSKMLISAGPYAFDGMKEQERRLAISQMVMADVLYMYLYLRYEALGADEPVVMRCVCPACRHDFKMPADLGSLEVRVVPETAVDLRRRYQLRDSIEIQGKERKLLYLRPINWGVMEDKSFALDNQAVREAKTLSASIVGCEGPVTNPLVISDNDLELMTKYDMEGIKSDIEENTPGPIMVLNSECPACKVPFQQMINWTYESFFTRSPQRRVGKR